MAFALLFNRQDLIPIAANLSSVNLSAWLTNEEVNLARACWNAGVINWDTASLAPPGTEDGQDVDLRILIVSGNYKGKTITVVQVQTLLRSMAIKIPGARYLEAIADEGASAWREPWI